MLNLLLILLGLIIILLGALVALPPTRSQITAKIPILSLLSKKVWAPYLVVIIGIAIVSGNLSTLKAHNAGFPDAQTYQAAQSAGLSTYLDYQKYLEEKEAQAKLAKIEDDKKRAEAALERDKEQQNRQLAASDQNSKADDTAGSKGHSYDWDLVVEGCKTWAHARQECATAGDFDTCMQVKNTGGGSGSICKEDGTPF